MPFPPSKKGVPIFVNKPCVDCGQIARIHRLRTRCYECQKKLQAHLETKLREAGLIR